MVRKHTKGRSSATMITSSEAPGIREGTGNDIANAPATQAQLAAMVGWVFLSFVNRVTWIAPSCAGLLGDTLQLIAG